MKDAKDKYDDRPFRYIILYSELKENKGNDIDFFFYFKDKKERLEADKSILKDNLWNFFKKIKYDYKDEFKKIVDEKNREIGYVVRCCSLEKIEFYVSKFNKKEINKSVKLSEFNFSNNFTKEMIQNNKDKINLSVNSNIYIFNLNEQKNNIMNNNMQNLNINNDNIIQNLNLEITNLKNEISNLKNNEVLKSEEITSLKNENNNLKNGNNNLKNENNNLKNEITNLKKTIQIKEDENKELKSRIDILINSKDKKPNLVDFDNIKIIQFLSTDLSVIYPIKCLPSDTFAEVEEKLYKIYPEYRETNNSFQVDGRNILRFKTIAENNIQEGHFVNITRIE